MQCLQTMPHPTKKQRLEGNRTIVDAADNDFLAGLDDLSVDVLANIFGFFSPIENMLLRRINKKSKEAVKKAIIPPTNFIVNSVRKANIMRVMSTVMPNLQKIDLRGLGRSQDGRRHKYSDGEDPDEERAAATALYATHDIGIISNFSKLRILDIADLYDRGLNGRYPVLFSRFPLLQKLSIRDCQYLQLDLEMLAELPLLKELEYNSNKCLTGNINSVRVLKSTLEKVKIFGCRSVEGNFMDLADFPHLKELKLGGTAVTGDVRDIGVNDFSVLGDVRLPKGVYGGNYYEFQRISDALGLVRALYLLKKQRPTLSMLGSWRGELSRTSPDWYEPADLRPEYILFSIHFVKAGSRIGYQWQNNGHWCEVIWLDPEPDRDSSGYAKYIEKLRRIEMQRKVKLFKGLNQPPTEEEYNRLLEEYDDESSEGSEESDCLEYNASDDDW